MIHEIQLSSKPFMFQAYNQRAKRKIEEKYHVLYLFAEVFALNKSDYYAYTIKKKKSTFSYYFIRRR